MKDALCVILGGGRGSRLYPLTQYRAKPAVPLAGKYRLIDIPISNCLNSGMDRIVILTQFNSESLNRHIARAYKFEFFSGGFVEIIAAEQSMDHIDWFQGSADAVRKSFRHFSDPRIKYILILSGDQLYRMNFSDIIRFHRERNSEITIACNPVRREETPELGIVGVSSEFRVNRFVEKPAAENDISSLAIPRNDGKNFLASMGIYVFNKEVLAELLTENAKDDFGKGIIPDAIASRTSFAYVHDGYWKDIGSISSFYEENLAFTLPEPPLDLFDEEWRFFTRPRYLPVSKIFRSSIESSNIAEGAIITDARIRNSVIGLRSIVGRGTVVEDSVVMGNDYYLKPLEGIGDECVLTKTIIDKNVRIGNGCRLTNHAGRRDAESPYCVIRNGIIIVPKNTVIPPRTVI